MINFYKNSEVCVVTKPKVGTRILDFIFNADNPYSEDWVFHGEYTKSNWFYGGKSLDVKIDSNGVLNIGNSDSKEHDGRKNSKNIDIGSRIQEFNDKIFNDKGDFSLYFFTRNPLSRFISGIYQELFVRSQNYGNYLNGGEYNENWLLHSFTPFSKDTLNNDPGLSFIKKMVRETQIINMSLSPREEKFMKIIVKNFLKTLMNSKNGWITSHTDNYLIEYMFLLLHMKSTKNVKFVDIEKTDIRDVLKPSFKKKVKELEDRDRNTSQNWLRDLIRDEIYADSEIKESVFGYLHDEQNLFNYICKKYKRKFVY